MALKRTTKSIPLSGGINQQAADFLVEAPSMSNMVNVRYTKKDTAEKATPRGQGVISQTSHFTHQGYSGPVAFYGEGEELALVGENELGVSNDAGVSFEKRKLPWTTFGLESKLSTDPAPGGCNFSWGPIGELDAGGGPSGKDVWTHEYYGIAYEIRDSSADTQLGGVSVAYELYNADNHLVYREVFAGHRHPRVLPSYDGIASGNKSAVRQVFYTVDSVGDIYHHVMAGTTGITTTRVLTGWNPFRFNQLFDRVAPNKYDSAGTAVEFEEHELGLAWNMRMDGALEVDVDLQGDEGIIAWKDDTGVIKWSHTSGRGLSYAPTGTVRTLVTDTQWTQMWMLLDCKVHNGKGYILVADHDLSLGVNVFHYPVLYEVNLSTGATTNSLQLNSQTGRTINGSVDLNIAAGNQFTIACSVVGGDVKTLGFGDGTGDSEKVTVYACFDFTTAKGPTSTLINQRLVSKLAHDKDYRSYACVQQYFKASPRVGTYVAKAEVTPVYGAVKPVTTVMMQLSNDENGDLCVPCAVFDPGTSKHMPSTMMQQNSHLGDLFAYNYRYSADILGDYADNQMADTVGGTQDAALVNTHFLFVNRSVVELDDVSFSYLGTVAPNATTYDGRWSLSAGQGKGTLYRVRGDAITQVRQAQWQNSMFFSTAVPACFDGYNAFEASVLDQPEITYLKPTSGTDVSYVGYAEMNDTDTTDLPKYFQAVIGFYDDNGMVHRSAPSFPVYGGDLVATPPGASPVDQTVLVHVTPPLTTMVEDQVNGYNYPEKSWFCEIYVGEVGAPPLLAATESWSPKRTGSSLSVKVNCNHNPTTTAAVKDIILSSAPIYTTGNVLAADPWPNLGTVVTTSRRLFGTSISAPGDIFYSKVFESGVAPEFNASLIISLGTGNKVYALGEVDDKVLAWTANGVFMIYGAGPDNTGANGDFVVEQLQSVAGCTEQRSVCKVPDGIIFYSDTTQEFHMISRDMVQHDIGKPVRDLTSGDVTILAGGTMSSLEEVWYFVDGFSTRADDRVGQTGSSGAPPRALVGRDWASGTGIKLTYNYEHGKWAQHEFDNDEDLFYQQTSAGVFGVKSFNVYPYGTGRWDFSPMTTVESPWIKVNQLQDFGRMYQLTFLGRYLSDYADTHGNGVEAGDIKITLKYDYEEDESAQTDTFTFRANQDLLKENGKALQLKVRPTRQKCQSLKVVIEEVATTAIELHEPVYTTGRGFEITAVDIEYGAKGGSSKLSSGRKK